MTPEQVPISPFELNGINDKNRFQFREGLVNNGEYISIVYDNELKKILEPNSDITIGNEPYVLARFRTIDSNDIYAWHKFVQATIMYKNDL